MECTAAPACEHSSFDRYPETVVTAGATGAEITKAKIQVSILHALSSDWPQQLPLHRVPEIDAAALQYSTTG